MSYIKMEEDGEVEEGAITSEWGVCTFTLSAYGDFNYYCFRPDDEGDDELVKEAGKWSYADKDKMLTLSWMDENGTHTAKLKVLAWTPSNNVLITSNNRMKTKSFRVYLIFSF